jgi:Transposase DDE domain
MTAAPDFGYLEPMLDAAQRELQAAGVSDRPEVLLADAGYWHQPQMERIIDRGIQVLIAPDASKRKGARRGWEGGYDALMRRVLGGERGGELYRQRQPMIEPVFGQTKFNRGIDRFRRRGRGRGRGQDRMAADHGDAQPAQAASKRPRRRLKRPDGSSRAGAPPNLAAPRVPPTDSIGPQTYATASREGGSPERQQRSRRSPAARGASRHRGPPNPRFFVGVSA